MRKLQVHFGPAQVPTSSLIWAGGIMLSLQAGGIISREGLVKVSWSSIDAVCTQSDS